MNSFSVYHDSFLAVNCPGMKLTTHLHLVPRSRICGGIPLIPLYAFSAQTGTCLPLPFTINLTHILYIFYIHHCNEHKLFILLESGRISFNSLQTDNIGTDLHVTQHNGMFQLNNELLKRFRDTGFL
jgi:hypothetical protein